LQSTADLLSGQAAQAGVELVLFHGDVGIKHVSVKGDGEGLGYALSVVSGVKGRRTGRLGARARRTSADPSERIGRCFVKSSPSANQEIASSSACNSLRSHPPRLPN
jgi:hypothetical protein